MGKMVFELDEDQVEKYVKWISNHNCPYWKPDLGSRYVGAAGGADKFVFCPTGIGEIKYVKCCCGAELDFSEWY